MTVQELIDKLGGIDDKSLLVHIPMVCQGSCYYEEVEEVSVIDKKEGYISTLDTSNPPLVLVE